jgi:hypothetical protein
MLLRVSVRLKLRVRKRRRNTKVQAFGNEEETRRSSGGAYRRKNPTTVGSQEEIPSSVGSGEVAHGLASGGGAHRRRDLSHQVSDQIPSVVRSAEAAQGLAVGISAIGNRSSRGRENWDSASRKIPTGSGPSVGRRARGGDPAPSAFGASGNWYSHGHNIGKTPGENPDIIRAVRSGGTSVKNQTKIRKSGNRESRGLVHFDIESAETPTK